MHYVWCLITFLYSDKRQKDNFFDNFNLWECFDFRSKCKINIRYFNSYSYLWNSLCNKKYKKVRVVIFTVLILTLAGITVKQAYQTIPRVKQILDKGLYADGSLASRIIRIDASINGFKKDIAHFTFGYGLGNAAMPIRKGYDAAMAEYREINGNDIPREIEELPYIETDSISYCLYTRMISEIGIVMTIIAIYYLFYLAIKGKNRMFLVYLFILLYLYIQFDSYAFYTIWLYIVVSKNYISNINGEKNAK